MHEPFPDYIKSEFKTKGYLPYQPTYYSIFARSILDLKLLKFNPAKSTIIDIGAGKGKAMVLASYFGFKKVIGIEIEKYFFLKASCEVELLKKKYPDKEFELYNIDAINYFPKQTIDVVFLFNPFREKILEQLLSNFASVHFLPTYIIYLNPVARKVVESFGYSPKFSLKTGLHTEYIIFKFGK